jgi:hypothetical protein
MAQEIGNLEVVLSAQTAAFDKGMSSAIKSIEKMQGQIKESNGAFQSFNQQFSTLTASLRVLSGAFAAIGGVGFIKTLLDQADAANDLGDAFGIAVGNVYAYQIAILSAGGKADGFQQSLQKLSNNITDAFEGSKTARNGFEQLGITLESIKNLGVSEIYDKVAVALSKIEDPARRNALALDLLGKAAVGINWAKYVNEIGETKKTYDELTPSIERAAQASEDLAIWYQKATVNATAFAGFFIDAWDKATFAIKNNGQGVKEYAEKLKLETVERSAQRAAAATVELGRQIRALQGSARDPFESWKEGLEKSTMEAGLFTKKMEYLDAQMEKAVTAQQIKQIQIEIEKLNGKNPFEAWEESVFVAQEQFDQLIPKLQALAEYRNDDLISLEVYNREVEKLGYNVKATSNEFSKMGDDIAQAIGQNANNAVNNFIDSIGTAKFTFTDFATSILKDLIKVMVQLTIMKPLIDGMRGFFGGYSSSPIQLASAPIDTRSASLDSRGMATETSSSSFGITPFQMRMADMSVPSLSMPSSRGVTIIQPASDITINNMMSGEAKVTAAETTNRDGSKSIKIMVEREVKELFGSGAMDKSMRASYGLMRVAS